MTAIRLRIANAMLRARNDVLARRLYGRTELPPEGAPLALVTAAYHEHNDSIDRDTVPCPPPTETDNEIAGCA